MIKYVIWCDEPKANPIIETSKETAIATFDRETLKYNKKYKADCMTVAEMLEEQPNADFDDLIKGCDFVYCEKFEGEEEEINPQIVELIKDLTE